MTGFGSRLICGDCLDVLKTLPDCSVDAVVTDPPYGLRFMGKGWDHGVPGVGYWREVLRVAKPGAWLVAAGGTRTHHRLMCAVEDAGWELRDVVMWVYGSGFPKSLDVSKAIDKAAGAEREVVGRVVRSDKRGGNFHGASEVRPPIECNLTVPSTDSARKWLGWGTALKPAWEPWVLARKPLEGTVAGNAVKWGTGGLNIDGCRVGTDESLGRMNNSTSTFNHKNTTPWVDNSTGKGRWPANFIHDGSDEVVRLFSGSAARFFYCAKASRAEREAGCEGLVKRPSQKMGNGLQSMVGHPSGTTGNTSTEDRRSKNFHPTVKPIALMRYLVCLVTPPGGTVLDPFMGSGSTGVAAVQEGCGFVGIELDPEYCKIAKCRIDHETTQLKLPI